MGRNKALAVGQPPRAGRKTEQTRWLRADRLFHFAHRIVDIWRQRGVVFPKPQADLLGVVGHLALDEERAATATNFYTLENLECLVGGIIFDVGDMGQLR